MKLGEGVLLGPLKALFWSDLIEKKAGGRAQVWEGQRVLRGKETSVRGASGWGGAVSGGPRRFLSLSTPSTPARVPPEGGPSCQGWAPERPLTPGP